MKTVIVFLAEGFEEVEAVTSIDFLRRAGLMVVTVGIGGEIIEGSHGIKITADVVFSGIKKLMTADALVFPGGMPGAKNIAEKKDIIDLVNHFTKEGKIVAAICASPGVILSKTDAIKDKKVTCYPGFEKYFTKETTFIEDSVVVDKNLITSRAPGTAAEFSLELVKMLKGNNIADEIKKKTLQGF